MDAGRTRLRVPNGFVRSISVLGAFLFWLSGAALPALAQQQWESVPGAASDIAIADDDGTRSRVGWGGREEIKPVFDVLVSARP